MGKSSEIIIIAGVDCTGITDTRDKGDSGGITDRRAKGDSGGIMDTRDKGDNM